MSPVDRSFQRYVEYKIANHKRLLARAKFYRDAGHSRVHVHYLDQAAVVRRVLADDLACHRTMN